MSKHVSENCKADLDQLLRASVLCASGLKEILNDERAALERQNTEALNEAAASKQLSLSRLEALETERREICEVSGFSSRPEDMEEMVKTCDSELSNLERWNQFVELARECSELNIKNGAIINLRRQQITGALSVIRGESQDNETYSRNGLDTASNAKRVLAEI